MSSGQTPPGWHPDPEDASQLRYWDGAEWTEHRSPVQATTNVAPPPPTAAPERPTSTGAFICAILGALIALVPILGFVAIPLGIIAVVLGISGLRRKPQRSKLSLASTLIGTIALVLPFVMLAALSDAIDEIVEENASQQGAAVAADAGEGNDSANNEFGPASGITVNGNVSLPFPADSGVLVMPIGDPRFVESTFEDVIEVPVAVLNNTSETVSSVSVSAIVRDQSGNLVEGSEEEFIRPEDLGPGKWGLGTLEVKNLELASLGTIEYTVTFNNGSCDFFCTTTADISEWNFNSSGNGVTGIAVARDSMSFARAQIFCFDDSSRAIERTADLLAVDSLDEGQQSVFVLETTSACENFALLVQGI